MKPLLSWVTCLSITTSLVVIVGSLCCEYDAPVSIRRPRGSDPVYNSFVQVAGSVERRTQGVRLRQMATDAARLCRVPVALFHALIERESSWRPFVVSSAGAVGLTQIRPYHGSPLLDLFDSATNLSLGACLLRRHFDRLKGWHLDDARAWRMALEAYHGGQYRTRTAEITRRYAAQILRGTE